jgi:glyoxylase-like metal-dependent hydrolase (beta-lactamase superfamily II)
MKQSERAARGVHRLRTGMVNVYFVAESDSPAAPWALVDAGLRGSGARIRREAERRFDRPPSAILLTHAHFDHVGALDELARAWPVPVYAHPLELPYVTGRSPYPPPDPSAGGGLLTRASMLFPRGPIDLGTNVWPIPPDGEVPGLPEWQWLATPGHTPGHISFYRESDRTVIAGDAVVTTRQESALAVLLQRRAVWRPPAFFTGDWRAARRSVEHLAALEPNVLATGHGRVLAGEPMRAALRDLANNFDLIMPARGRYVREPALADERGVVSVPPRPGLRPAVRVAVVAGAAAAAFALVRHLRRTRSGVSQAIP